MRLSREAIQRMVGDRVGGGSAGGGGSAISIDDIQGMGFATEQWVNEKYLSIDFFNRLFQAYDSAATPNQVLPNDLESTITNIKAMFGFWTEQFVSALGYGPGGGGGGDTLTEPLASINNASLGMPTAAGQVITWNGSEWIFDIPQGGGGGGGTGTVTSITAGAGLSGGTITTSGTISIASTYLTQIGEGHTAYGWGNHANAGYLTSSDIADMATKTWVNGRGFVTANNYLTAVTGSANGTMTFAREGLSSITFDSRHTHSNYVSSIYYNNSATLTSPYYVVTSGSVSGNTLTLGRRKLSDLLNASGYTWWGQTMSASGVVSGNIAMNIGERINFDNKNTFEVDAYSVAIGYGWRSTKPIGLYGTAINFYPNGSKSASVESGGVIVGTSNTDTTHYIQIGGGRIYWDNTNNALYVQKADGTAAHFYATGGVSALGMSVGGTPSMNTLTLGTMTVTDNITVGSSGILISDPDGDGMIYSSGGTLTLRCDEGILANNELTVNGALYMLGNDIFNAGGVHGTSLHSSGMVYLNQELAALSYNKNTGQLILRTRTSTSGAWTDHVISMN